MDLNIGFLVIIFLIIVIGAIIVAVVLNAEPEKAELPYRLKKYFFSKTEQEFLRLLNESLDTKKYVIFPKVRLADFVEVTAGKEEYQASLNRIKSKHVDFLVWNIQEAKIALAIELDGKSHESERMQKSDNFKNELYTKIEVRLVRVLVGTDFKNEIEKIKSFLG